MKNLVLIILFLCSTCCGLVHAQQTNNYWQHDSINNYLYDINNNVGIGTSSPSHKLTVNGNTLINGTLTTTGLNVLQRIEADTIKGTIKVNVNGNLVLGEEGNYNGITTKQEDLRINSRPGFDFNTILNTNTNGNVGIGTSFPQEKLDVFGNVKVSGYIGADSISVNRFSTSQLKVNDSLKVGANSIWIGGADQFTGTNNHIYSTLGSLVLQSNNNTNNHTIINNNRGRVGIGTATPQTKLHIKGVTCPLCPLESEPDTANLGLTTYLRIEDQINNAQGQSVANSQWNIAVSATENRFFINQPGSPPNIFTITSQRKVGIGTSTPGQNYNGDLKLDVNGDARFYRNNNPNNYISIGYNSANAILDMGGQGSLLINYYSGKDAYIGTGQTKSNLYVGNGVGIATSYIPVGYKLAVEGKIIAEEVKVRLRANWPDYVFDKNYSLMPLTILEKFIEDNKHLPGIPSANEINSNDGFDIGEIQRKQLEKTEELFLYIIEMNKKINELEKQNVELQNQLKELRSK